MNKYEFQHNISYADDNFKNGTTLQVDKQFFMEHLPLNDLRVLDFGCGLGSLSLWMSKTFNCEVHAVDADPAKLTIARYLQQKHNVKRVTFGNATEYLKSPIEKFDVIVIHDLLEHIDCETKLDMMRKLVKRMSKNGKLVLAFSPWYGPYASHVSHVIGFPWCQVLPDASIEKRLRKWDRKSTKDDQRNLESLYKNLSRITPSMLNKTMEQVDGLKLDKKLVHSMLSRKAALSWLPMEWFPLRYLVTREIFLYQLQPTTD